MMWQARFELVGIWERNLSYKRDRKSYIPRTLYRIPPARQIDLRMQREEQVESGLE